MAGSVDFADLVNPLRIGFIADTHFEQHGLMRRAVSLMCEDGPIDYLVHLGDFLHNFKGRPGTGDKPYKPYERTAGRLDEISREFGLKGVGVIPGNHEVRHKEEGLRELEKFSIHKKVDPLVEWGGYNFLGYGGGYNFVQDNGWEAFDDSRYRCNSDELKGLMDGRDIDILLLHQLEDTKNGDSLRKVIEESKVKMVISGHTHNHGVNFYGKPIYASCGPIWPLDKATNHPNQLGNSSYAVLELENNSARMRFYFFKRDTKGVGDVGGLATGLKVNFDYY
jgi:predicted phosphodiesterase